MRIKIDPDCVRYERLLGKHVEDITEEEFNFGCEHPESCKSGLHTYEALEDEHGWPRGTFTNWNGRDPLPPPSEEAQTKRMTGFLRAVFSDEIPARFRLEEARNSLVAENTNRYAAPAILHRREDRDRTRILSRRRFLLSGLTTPAFVRTLAARGDQERESWIARGAFPEYLSEPPKRRGDSRIETLASILKPSGTIGYSIADSHPGLRSSELEAYWQSRGGFPHDRKAIEAFLRLDPESPKPRPGYGRIVPLKRDDNLVVAGSPVSSDQVRRYLPYRDLLHPDALIAQTFRQGIPYQFVIGRDETIIVRSGALAGKEKAVGAHGLFNTENGTLWRPRQYVSPHGRLKTDFLLISRLPRGNSAGDIVLLSGGHGAGIEAFSLALDERAFPDCELRALEKEVGGAQYFQIVLECTDIRDDVDMSRAYSLRVSETCAPQVINSKNLVLTEDE